MARLSWKKPPPAVAITGNQDFLRNRNIRGAIFSNARLKRDIVWADDDDDVNEALMTAATFGQDALIIANAKGVSAETVKYHIDDPVGSTCIILTHGGSLKEKGLESIGEVSEGYRVAFMVPTSRKGKREAALKFAKAEASRLVGHKKALEPILAEALIRAVGTDIGVLAHELVKFAALARARGTEKILQEHIIQLIRASNEVNLDPLRDALRARNGMKVAREMDKIRRNAGRDPLMLLLRSKGGIADLALRWLRTALLLEKGVDSAEISGRMSVPEWIVERDLIPAARRWGAPRLRLLVQNLAIADRGVQLGHPSPIVMCEASLLMGCLS